MAFKKMQVGLPPRQWALYGRPGDGKSTFATQMRAPMLVIDSDHRFVEVLGRVRGDVYTLSEDPADNVDARRIQRLIEENIRGSGTKTIVVDSLTSIISPLVADAIMANDEGENTNKVASFKAKAMAMRLLQDAVTGTGADTLWVYHVRDVRDAKAREKEATSISAVELARLQRSLNLILRVVRADNSRRGIKVEWARRGRSGITLWDETGSWEGMPEKIETAVYGGLSASDMEAIEQSTPTGFANAQQAIAWGFSEGVFRDAVHAENAYNALKQDAVAQGKAKKASDMWELWITDVLERKALVEAKSLPELEPEEPEEPEE